MPVSVLTGATEPIRVYAVNQAGKPLTGLTDLYVRLRRNSDGYFLDWNDLTFKASGWTTLNRVLTEIDATNLAGNYQVSGGLNTGSITNAVTNDIYTVYPLQTPGTNARLPAPDEMRMGRWVDQVNTTFNKLPDNNIMGSGVKTDKDDEIDAILTDTNEIQGKLPTNNIMGSAVKDDKDDEIDAILTDTNEIQGKLPDNYIMGSGVKTDKDDEIDSIKATVDANLDTTVSSRESETDAAARAATNQSEHDATQAAIAALDDAADIADAVWDEAAADHIYGGTMGQLENRLDANISTRSSHDPADVDTQLSGTHGSGSWEGITAAGVADAVWDELLASHLAAGSTGEALNNGASAPSAGDIADAVWDEALAGHTALGSTGEKLTKLDANVSSRAVAGDAMDLIAGAVDANALDSTAVAEIADGVWDEDVTGHVGGSSAGAYQVRLDADISTRAAPGDAMDLISGAVDAGAVDASGAAEIADAVWDELLSGHVGVGSAGESLGRVDVSVSSRAAPSDAMSLTALAVSGIVDDIWDEPLAGHLTAGSTGKALDDAGATADPNAIADAVWDEALTGHTTPGSMGQLQSRCDVAISTRAQPGDPMDLQGNALDAAALDASAVTEIVNGVWDEALAGHSGVGTAGEAQALVDAAVSSRAAPGDAMDLVTDALDSGSLADSGRDKVVDQVWREQLSDHSGVVGSTAEALGSSVAPPTPAVIADAVWDELLSGHTAAGSAGEALGRVDVDVSTRAAPGADMGLTVDAVDSSALATSAVQEIRDSILSDSTPFAGANIDAAISTRSSAAALAATAAEVTAIDGRLPADPADESNQLAAHGVTQTSIAALNDLSAAQVENAVWDATSASHLTPGTTGKALQDAGATADPGAIADAVWDEPAADHTAAGSMGEKQNSADSSGQIADAPTAWPPVAGSLLDRLANKDAGQTYDQGSDSLEAMRERIG
jgi:hypothetical protein